MTTRQVPSPLRSQIRTAINDAHRAHRHGHRFGRLVLNDGIIRIIVEDAAPIEPATTHDHMAEAERG